MKFRNIDGLNKAIQGNYTLSMANIKSYNDLKRGNVCISFESYDSLVFVVVFDSFVRTCSIFELSDGEFKINTVAFGKSTVEFMNRMLKE